MDETTAAATVAPTVSDTTPTEETMIPVETAPELPEVTQAIDYYIPEATEAVPLETAAETTVPTEPAYIEIIARASDDICHASLFGSFMLCGTLVGLFLLRGRNG